MKSTVSTILSISLMVIFLLLGAVSLSKKNAPADSSEIPIMEVQEAFFTPISADVSTLAVSQTTTVSVTTTTVTTTVATTTSVTDTTTASTTAATTTTSTTVTTSTTETQTTTAVTETTIVTTTTTQIPSYFCQAPDGYFHDALFIGDSRTVGMRDYMPLEGADYFASVGMSVYNAQSQSNPVNGRGTIDLSTTLQGKRYGKVYIMLGINEIGCDLNENLRRYNNILEEIRKWQPNAIIFIEANLHVAAARSLYDNCYNNANINHYNQMLAAFADNKTCFYLDVNPIFDDESGCLGAEYTGDNTHVYAKYYAQWNDFLSAHAVVQ